MLKSIFLLFTIFNLFAILKQGNCNPTSSIPAEDVEDLKTYINEINKHVNLNVKPCDDFKKYVCGNNKSVLQESESRNSILSDAVFAKYFNNTNTDLENKILNYHNKCSEAFNKEEKEILKGIFENVDIFKEAGMLPSKKEYTAKEIVKLATKNFAFGESALISFQVRVTLDESDNTYVLNLDNSNSAIRFNKTYYKNLFQLSGSKDEDIEKALIDIEMFINKINEINYSKKTNEKKYLESFDELKTIFPSKNWDWNELSSSVQKILNSKLKYKILVKDVNLTKKKLAAIDSVDPKVIANCLLFVHLEYLINSKCDYAERFFLYAIMRRVWNTFFTDKIKKNYIHFLDKFEWQFNKTLKNGSDLEFYENDNTVSEMYNDLKSKRDIVENHTDILSPKVMNMLYDDFNFDTSNIYQNVLNSLSNMLSVMWKLGETENNPNSISKKISNIDFDQEFDYDEGQQPLFYYDTSMSYKLWLPFYDTNSYEYYKLEKNPCLRSLNFNDEGTGSFYFLNALESIRSSYKNMDFEKNAIEFKEIGEDAAWLTPQQLFFISLAQQNCNEYFFFKAIKYSTEFMNSFECSNENTNLNEFNKCYNT